ncbi:MAG: penicillin-binding transpeptidase domain-containing protein [Rickettsia endosymbiont of Ixodes persulcatus]|nr:penicillin-binding transpeptidase domain-containing protein [Rickettsia endosymbiont of Ixodes persulcatus]
MSKTFVYLAALENGIKPNQIFNDGPIEISQGPGMPSWRPKNYEGKFLGEITMRAGLEKSRNLITVRVATAVGLTKIVD